ncbi:glycosyltransferase [Thalassotalea castellviae]|uniref:Glycosyltransferase n=1 Tax=Thalassotalea castellviae TaxID=3075612 RepID=A0ABU3A4N8_9GAMM|nr:glycosyltransferase [Thalassotalea sp. W431]MDT0604078.1 glycosyltransferase [Thalassotalea sp. W431]
MNVIVNCEFRFYQTPDGKVWTPSSFEYDFWMRYAAVFEQVTVVARIKPVSTVSPDWLQANGKQVNFHALPHYIGLKALIIALPRLIKSLLAVIKLDGLLLFRVPSQTATIATYLLKKNQPYAVEVIGDPYDVFSTGVGGKLAAPWLKMFSKRTLQKQCQHALGASYVTECYLQQRYPPGINTITSFYSSIMLDESQIVDTPRKYQQVARKLVFVGSLEQMYKALDILLQAFSLLVKADDTYRLTIIGAGQHLAELKALAQHLTINANVDFVGEIKSNEVINHLRQADLFVLPSRTEGLPRAIIEAMAQGLPCVGTSVGGIPELIPDELCVPADDATALFSVLNKLCNNLDELTKQSMINLEKSKQYGNQFLSAKRQQFYQDLKIQYHANLNKARGSN